MKQSCFLLSAVCVLLTVLAWAQKPENPPANQPAPHSTIAPDESSSRATLIDLSPPKDDSLSHPNSGVADDVLETHPWNPMKSMKAVEVGDYYFKEKNYKAALSRYEEALQWKPLDAIATYKLALAQEKLNRLEEARTNYAEYLKILPEGPYAEDCHKALERLGKPTTAPRTNQKP